MSSVDAAADARLERTRRRAERDSRPRAAARADRHAFRRRILIELVGDAVQIAVGRRRRSEREPATLSRGVEIALEQRRRQLQHAGDVVEAVADRRSAAARRRRRRAPADRGPRSDTRRDSGGGTARCGPDSDGRRAAIERGLERPTSHPCVALRPRHAGGRHQAGAQLADHRFPFVAACAATAPTERLERPSRPSARRRRGSSCNTGSRWLGAGR